MRRGRCARWPGSPSAAESAVRCALWDDDWMLCSLSSGSRYSGIRTAVCDAAVEVIGEYGGERPQSPSATGREPLGAVIDV